MLLESDDSENIQNIALRKELAYAIPLPGPTTESHRIMRDAMPDWKELSIVFRDDRTLDEAWHDTEMKFRDLTSRQKRRGFDNRMVMYARQQAKVLNRWQIAGGDEPLHYRFVVPKKTEDDLEMSFENYSYHVLIFLDK